VPLLHRVELLGHSEDTVLGAVCYSFAGGILGKSLQSLDEQLCVPERAQLVRKVMDSLFGKPARSWYAVTAERVAAMPYVTRTHEVDLESCHDQLDDAGRALARHGEGISFTAADARHDGELTAGKAKLRLPRRTIWGDGVFQNALPTCLVHGDMHGGNVMVELDGESLSRVCLIDYANAGPGPRLTDFVALEASVRLRDMQAILTELGVGSKRELDDAGYRRAAMRAAARVGDERKVLRAVWDEGAGEAPEAPWALTAMQLSLLAHANFDWLDEGRLEESEYLAMALPCAFRHMGFHISQLARIRFAAWISALYERLTP
jgi:hypothetical protein